MEETTVSTMPLLLDEPLAGIPVWVEQEEGEPRQDLGELHSSILSWEQEEQVSIVPPPCSSPNDSSHQLKQACDKLTLERVDPLGDVLVTDSKQLVIPSAATIPEHSTPENEPLISSEQEYEVNTVESETIVDECGQAEAILYSEACDDKEALINPDEPVDENAARTSEMFPSSTEAVPSDEKEDETEDIEDYSDEVYPPCCIMEFKQGFYPIFNRLPFGPAEQDILFLCDDTVSNEQLSHEHPNTLLSPARNRSGSISQPPTQIEEGQQQLFIELFEGSLTHFIAEIKKLFGITNDLTIEFPQLDLSLAESSIHCSSTSLKQLCDLLYAVQVNDASETFEPLKIAIFESRNAFVKQFEYLNSLFDRMDGSTAKPLDSAERLSYSPEEMIVPPELSVPQYLTTEEPELSAVDHNDLVVTELGDAEGYDVVEDDMAYEEDEHVSMEPETTQIVETLPQEEYPMESDFGKPDDVLSEEPENDSAIQGNLKRKEADLVEIEPTDVPGSDTNKRIRA